MNEIIRFFSWINDSAPQLLLAAAVLIGGVVASWLIRGVVRWLGVRIGLDRAAEKTGLQQALGAVGLKRPLSYVLGSVLYVAALLFTASAVAEVFDLPGVAIVTSTMMVFLPRLLSGAFMLLAGFWVASLVRTLLMRFATSGNHLDAPGIVAQFAYYALVVVTAMLTAEQVGLETGLANTVVTLLMATVVAACALGFGLGSRNMFECIVAKHHYSKEIQPGDHVRIGEHEGVVVRYTPVALVVKSQDGEVILPCKTLIDGPVKLDKLSMPEAPRE